MKRLKKIEINSGALGRAALYAMGVVGFIHFFSSLLLSIQQHSLADINPSRLINVERFFGKFANNGWFFVFGWLIFFSLIAVIYRHLTNPEPKN